MNIISETAIKRREYWIKKIQESNGRFSDNAQSLENDLSQEIKQENSLLDHLRLCGDIPESYKHDSSEEKQYSKYTDALLSQSFKALGLNSLVLTERADAADVEVFAKEYSFVADAKAFRLSRSAKNQKDFKIEAMAKWKYGKPYAMVVCPIYQLPIKASQIYQQASTRNVCIFTYSHLAVLVSYSLIAGQEKAELLLHELFKTIPALNPSKDAYSYWLSINKTMLDFSPKIQELWQVEKQATLESIAIAKQHALTALAQERENIMRLSYEDALKELIKVHKIDGRIKTINQISDNALSSIGENND